MMQNFYIENVKFGSKKICKVVSTNLIYEILNILNQIENGNNKKVYLFSGHKENLLPLLLLL
jgi:hypothetical protein